MKVTPPAQVPVLDVNIGTLAGDVKIEALDVDGRVIHAQSVPHANKIQLGTIKAAAGKIASLIFTGGCNEGNLVSICVKLAVVP